jgi:spoIIIJ-associated protein
MEEAEMTETSADHDTDPQTDLDPNPISPPQAPEDEETAEPDDVAPDPAEVATHESEPEVDPGEEGGEPGSAAPEGRAGTRIQQLEEEGDIAADYLEGLLDIADQDGDIDLDVEGDRASVSVVGDQLTVLVGENGAVLEALQELTRLAVYRETGERSRLMLDIGGFRAEKRKALESLARDAAEEVRETGDAVKLSPMTPFERKVVHDAVAEQGLRSESEGVEPSRCVVVMPAK